MAIKKLPIISIALVAVGLLLILYADPVLTSTGGPALGGPGAQRFNGTTSGGGTQTGQNFSRIPIGNGPGGGNGELFTLIGTALIGAGLVASAVEAVSKPSTGSGPQAVA